MSLEREAPENFDVLAVDAFSSDSIPVHLLTLEAIELYFRHLRPDGVLAVHISRPTRPTHVSQPWCARRVTVDYPICIAAFRVNLAAASMSLRRYLKLLGQGS